MERYAVFGFEVYYPEGGMNDFLYHSNDYNACLSFIEKDKGEGGGQKDIYDIWDMQTMIRKKHINAGFY